MLVKALRSEESPTSDRLHATLSSTSGGCPTKDAAEQLNALCANVGLSRL